jgi:hypothetical protein
MMSVPASDLFLLSTTFIPQLCCFRYVFINMYCILLGINQTLSQPYLTQYHHRRILTDDLVLSLRQVIANHAAYVSPETVANAVYMINGSARISEMGVQLSGALTH